AGTLIHLGPEHDEEETLTDLLRGGGQIQGISWATRGLDRPAVGLSLRTDLVALEEEGSWKSRLGAIPDVTVVPGRKLVVRYADHAGQPIADVMHGVSERVQPAGLAVIVGHLGVGAPLPIEGAASATPLLAPAMRSGRRVAVAEPVEVPRERLNKALAALPAAYARLRHPARFPVGCTPALAERRAELLRGYP
ncbi:MAG: hypothetical protein MUF54_14460, partial [Polyangiaceae bacterium]|nr:hypothetical protein [Polyangiaceae bacterium]